MSKAFTKEDDDSGQLRLDDLPQSPHPNLVTPAGLADLQTRLRAKHEELAALRSDTEALDSKLAVAKAMRDIRFLEGRISRAIVVDPASQAPGIVAFGAEVDVILDDDTQQTFRIVGEDAADPARGHITPYSPLGAALMGADIGSVVEWKKPNGSVDVEVISVRFP